MAKFKRHSAARKADWRKSLGLHPDFPLCRHPAGYWVKNVKSKLHYFGKLADDPKGQAALEEWERVKEALLAGRTPRSQVDGVTVAELCDRFMQANDAKLQSGDIGQKTWIDYKRVCNRMVAKFGKSRVVVDLASEDFEALRANIAKNYGPVVLQPVARPAGLRRVKRRSKFTATKRPDAKSRVAAAARPALPRIASPKTGRPRRWSIG